MDLATFQRLLTPAGQATLAAAQALNPTEDSFLACLGPLQKQADSALAKAALETVLLRRKARVKFSRADQMYFVREALEQASGEGIARYRAGRFAAGGSVADLGCGLGGDTLALAERGPVLAVDLDPLRLALAEQNLAVYGMRDRVTLAEADLTQVALAAGQAVFFDPARRTAGRRRFSVQDYIPPLAAVHTWLERNPAVGVKISPGVDLAELAEYACECEFISVQGELKECLLWFGPFHTVPRRATLLPGGQTLTAVAHPPLPTVTPRRYVYEPDPAVLRAGLVTTLAVQLEAWQMDVDIAYLTSDTLRPTPFARAFVIEEAFPFQLKRLRERLRTLGVGTVTVKKRGSPLEPEALIHQLKLSGPESRLVFLTHVQGAAWALIGQPVTAAA